MMRNNFQAITKAVLLLIASFFLSLALLAQENPLIKKDQGKEKQIEFPQASQYSSTKLSYRIIGAPNNTHAYDIYADGKLMIHQASIPALPGNEGFKTKAGAEKVAKLVIDKIQKGEMPPTVSIEELKKLKAIK